jgi:long-subunit acyl-CoA synthetase (AMP-forming)
MVLYSSGTTSAPKAVELSHLSLNVHAEAIRFCRYLGPTQPLLTCLPFFHVAGSVVCPLFKFHAVED